MELEIKLNEHIYKCWMYAWLNQVPELVVNCSHDKDIYR